MKPFSQIYIESILVKSILEKIPESERQEFVRNLQSFMSEYDHLAANSSSVLGPIDSSRDDKTEVPAQSTRRPPRRS